MCVISLHSSSQSRAKRVGVGSARHNFVHRVQGPPLFISTSSLSRVPIYSFVTFSVLLLLTLMRAGTGKKNKVCRETQEELGARLYLIYESYR